MRDFVIQHHSHKVRYTATMGTKIFHDTDNVAFFRFHGSPDLTISQKSGEEEHSTMMIETISGLRSTHPTKICRIQKIASKLTYLPLKIL